MGILSGHAFKTVYGIKTWKSLLAFFLYLLWFVAKAVLHFFFY